MNNIIFTVFPILQPVKRMGFMKDYRFICMEPYAELEDYLAKLQPHLFESFLAYSHEKQKVIGYMYDKGQCIPQSSDTSLEELENTSVYGIPIEAENGDIFDGVYSYVQTHDLQGLFFEYVSYITKIGLKIAYRYKNVTVPLDIKGIDMPYREVDIDENNVIITQIQKLPSKDLIQFHNYIYGTFFEGNINNDFYTTFLKIGYTLQDVHPIFPLHMEN